MMIFRYGGVKGVYLGVVAECNTVSGVGCVWKTRLGKYPLLATDTVRNNCLNTYHTSRRQYLEDSDAC